MQNISGNSGMSDSQRHSYLSNAPASEVEGNLSAGTNPNGQRIQYPIFKGRFAGQPVRRLSAAAPPGWPISEGKQDMQRYCIKTKTK